MNNTHLKVGDTVFVGTINTQAHKGYHYYTSPKIGLKKAKVVSMGKTLPIAEIVTECKTVYLNNQIEFK